MAPKNEQEAAFGTGIAGCVAGLVGWLFLWCEGVPIADVGLGRRVWVQGRVLSAVWWAG